VRDLTPALMAGFLVFPYVNRFSSVSGWSSTEVKPAGREMNFHWARSEKFLLVGLAISAVIVGVLTILVITQEQDPSTVTNTPAGTAPQPARGPTAPPLAPAPPVTAPPSAPAQVVPASRITTPTQLAPPSPKLLKATTLPRRRSNPVPAPSLAAATHPVVVAPPPDPAPAAKPGSPDGWDPGPPARSHPAGKPGSPDGG
jgi:hypothetical protein